MVLNIGDKPNGMASQRVKHKDTGNIGRVVDYGHRIVNNKCLDTVKVKLINSTSKNKSVVQDLDSQWLLCPKEDRGLLPDFREGKLNVNQTKKYYSVRS